MTTGKMHLHFSKALLLAALLAFGACKEKKAFNEETAQVSVDHRSAVGEMDEVLKDINTVILERHSLRGRSSSAQTPTTTVCGVKLDTTGQLKGTMTLVYGGSNCFGRVRTGKVSFTVQEYPVRKWKQKDCVLRIEFLNYQSKRSSDGKTVKLEGIQFLKNESGNTWFELWYTGTSSVSYLHSGESMKVTYSGDETAALNVSRRLTFTFSDNVTSCIAEGTGNSLGESRVECWGQDTEGLNFAAEVSTPYLWKTTCGAVAPLSGKVNITVEGKSYDLECRYGVDQEANQVNPDALQCPFGWEVNWSRKKRTNTRLFGYY